MWSIDQLYIELGKKQIKSTSILLSLDLEKIGKLVLEPVIYIPNPFFRVKWRSSYLLLCHFCNVRVSTCSHGLRTPNEGKNKKNMKFRANVAEKICFGSTYKFGIGFDIFQWAHTLIFHFMLSSNEFRLSLLYWYDFHYR